MRAMSAEWLVTIIIIIVSAIVLLVVLAPKVFEVLAGSEQAGSCAFSLLWTSGISKATFGLENIPPECEAERDTITKAELDRVIYDFDAQARLRDLHDFVTADSEINSLKYALPLDDPNSVYRFAFMKVLADSLDSCRHKVIADQDLSKTGGLHDTLCIICSRLAVDDSARSVLRQGSYPLRGFAKMYNPSFASRTYLDGLLEGSDFSAFDDQVDLMRDWYLSDSGSVINDVLSRPEEAVGIIYFYAPIVGSDNVRFVRPVPYGKISTYDMVELSQPVVEALFTEEKSKCVIQVG